LRFLLNLLQKFGTTLFKPLNIMKMMRYIGDIPKIPGIGKIRGRKGPKKP